MTLPFEKRRDVLRNEVYEKEKRLTRSKSRDCKTVEEIEEFMEQACKDPYGPSEGLMVKTLRDWSEYEPEVRS